MERHIVIQDMMRIKVRKVTKQLPARAFSVTARKLLYVPAAPGAKPAVANGS
jgi:hypothetical protein